MRALVQIPLSCKFNIIYMYFLFLSMSFDVFIAVIIERFIHLFIFYWWKNRLVFV